MEDFHPAVVFMICTAAYVLGGYITFHTGKLFALFLVFMERWGSRTKLNSQDWNDAFNCYNVYGRMMFAMEPLFAFVWPMAWGVMAFNIPITIVMKTYQRYLSELRLKDINSQYRLRPRWMNKKSFLELLNRFI